jgi:uroporphyrin-III C-methyltransferase
MDINPPSSSELSAPRAAPLNLRSVVGWVGAGIAVVLAVAVVVLWTRVSGMQSVLAQQSADTTVMAQSARESAREAQELVRETAARLSVAEARLGEVALQRGQLEELIQSLSRSRDENLVVDIDAALRLAMQQAELTGSLQPLLAALKTADTRIHRSAQPRFGPLSRALARDIDRVRGAASADVPSLLIRMDDMVRWVDELMLAQSVGEGRAAASVTGAIASTAAVPGLSSSGGGLASLAGYVPAFVKQWAGTWSMAVMDEFRGLVRVSTINHPDAVLISPEQAFFLRENLKLRLLNARLAVLSRQFDAARSDLTAVEQSIRKYCDPAHRKTVVSLEQAGALQRELRNTIIPRIDDSLAALTTAGAAR